MPLTADEIDALDVGEVAPASRQRTLTADEIDSIEPAPQIGAGRQAFSRFARAALGGVAGTLEAIPIAATALASKFGDPLLSETEERDVTSRPLYRAGQAIRRAAENAYPVDQNRPKSFLVDTLPQGAGSMAAFIAGGAAGKVAGASTWATVGALGGGVSGAEAFDEATKSGANDEDAFKVFAINAGLGTTEAVPIAGWLNRLNKASGNKLKRAIIEGSEEAAQEVFQQVGGNLTAQKYYDPDRKLFEGAGEGGAAGFTLGSLMSLVVSAIGGRRARVPETRIQTVTDDRGLSRFAPVKEEAEAKAPAVRTAAVLAQAQPIEPEVARQKLWVIMQDEEMDIPLDQWQQPASPHLKLVLGDNAPSWRDLNFSGVVTANKNPNGTYRVKVIPRTTEQTLPVATETGIADELNQLRAIATPAMSGGAASLAESTGGISEQTAAPIIAAWREANPNAPEVEVVNRQDWTQTGTDWKQYGVRGWWDGQKITINVAFVADANAVREVLNHELVHPLLDSAQGQAAIQSAITQELGGDALAKIQQRYKQGATESDEQYQRRATAEWFAQLRETTPSLWQRIVARVREFLSRLNIVDLSDAEIGGAMFRKLERDAGVPYTEAGLQAASLSNALYQFYSRLTRTVEQSQQGKGSGAQWKATIRNSKLGANMDEFALVGVNDLEDGKVYTKAEVLEYLKANEIAVKDVTLGGPTRESLSDDATRTGNALFTKIRKLGQVEIRGRQVFDDEVGWGLIDGDIKPSDLPPDLQSDAEKWVKSYKDRQGFKEPDPAHFATYQLPGSKEGSYREVLLTVPEAKKSENAAFRKMRERSWTKVERPDGSHYFFDSEGRHLGDTTEEAHRMADDFSTLVSPEVADWKDGHAQYSNVKNPIVRIRLNERTTSDGKRMLFLEEVQAPQKGEFEKMPALFQKNWREIAFKWALRHAAENGFDSIGWTTGEQQAERYDLSKHVDSIEVVKGADDVSWHVRGMKGNSSVVGKRITSLDELDAIIGKDLAAKAREGLSALPASSQDRSVKDQYDGVKYSGVDLKIGGGGIAKLYDSDFRNVVNNLPAVKKAGQKVGTAEIQSDFVRTFDGRDIPLDSFYSKLQSIRGPWANPATRTAEGWQRWNVSLDKQADDVLNAMRRGDAYSVAMQQHGTQALADVFGGTFGRDERALSIHSLTITPAIRESLMGGQAMFSLTPEPTGEARSREEEGEKAITQVQSVKVGVEREAENIAAIQQTIRADIFDGTQPVSASATAQARELFVRLTDPAGKAAAAGDILTKTNAQMGPGLVLAELWRYAERTVLATGDDSLLRQIVPHYQDFPLGESGAGSTAFGRGLRALQETDTLFKQLYEIEKGKRTAAGEQMSVGPELLEALLAGLKGEVPDATVLERKTRTVLGTKVPQNKVEEIVRVVRANIVDPITALVDHFSKMAGFPAVTPEQHEQLIKLAQQLSDPNLSIPEKSELIDQMFEVFNRLKLPPSLLTRLAANLVATNLTGFKTLGINIFSPTVQGLVDLGLTGITSPRDFPAMLKGAIDGGKQWLANIRYSMGRDAYSFLSNDYQAAQNVLKQMWQRGLQQIKSNSWSERSRGLANLIFGLQQYYMRLLNAVDNANGILRRQMQMSLYSSQAMRRFGMNSQEIRDVTEMFYLMRDQFYAQAVEMGLTENQSRIRASALAYQEFVDFLNNELPTDSAGRPIGSEIAKAAHHEAMSVLGRLSEGVNEIDEGGLVKRTVGAPILYLSNWMRQQEGLMPAIGVSLLGYVNVPYRTASYYAWNTPYGLVRLGIHKWRKSKKKESWWKQSLATEFQEQQRLKNALAGSAVLAALTGIGIGLLNTSAGDDAGDDDDNSVYFTGNGPKNKNLRSAWIAKGFRPQSLVVFVGGKPVVMELSRSGESLAHYAWLLAARDDRAWREKEAKATNRKYAPTPSKEAAYAIGTYLGLLGQRGFLQTVTQAGNVASGQADPLAFAASKGGSFVSGLFTPGLGLQRSVQGLLHGPVDASSVQSAFLANFPMLSITGINHPKVNAFGDPLYNPENSWYHKMKETGIPIAFSTSPTTENKQLYGLMVEKGVAPRELRRSTVENKYGPLTDAEFSQFAQKSGKLLKEQTVNNLPMLQNMTQEGVKKWLNSATASADRVTAMGMNLEPVKPQAVSSGASSALPTAPATGLTRRSGVPTGSIAGPRRTGLARLAASRVGGRSRIARPRFASLRGLGRPTRRRRSIVGRLGRVRRPRGLSMRGLRRPRMPRPRRLRRRLTLV